MRSRALAGREAGLTARRACMLRPRRVDNSVYVVSTRKGEKSTIFYTDRYRDPRNRASEVQLRQAYLPATLFGWLSDFAALAALAPAIRPNTEPLVRPVPPG